MSLLADVLTIGRELEASDVHISSNKQTTYRVHGSLVKHGPIINAKNLDSFIEEFENQHINKVPVESNYNFQHTLLNTLAKTGSVDFGYTTQDCHRYRVNIFKTHNTIAMALRFLPNNFQSLQALHLPNSLAELSKSINGLVLVCGATGSGKSTTLAALINSIANTRSAHIITIEDPIEFLHKSETSLIHQRELGQDFFDFPTAVRASLREDPDVLMVGEMRDLDTIRAALTAAETGHLVFSTLHTNDAVSSVERLIGAFPGNEQDLVKTRLSRCLKAVVAQHLIPTNNGLGRVPAAEILLNNSAVANLIESNKTRQLYSVIESNQALGMQTLDQSLANLIASRWINLNIAKRYAKVPERLNELVQRAGGQPRGH